MASLRKGWNIQKNVLHALMLRELTTRFGRENIGFLWVMVEPLLFAVFVGLLWRAQKGPMEHGMGIFAFVVSGYIPLVLFRSSISRAVNIFTANGALLYHRQIKILDFVVVRFAIECIGHMMAYLFVALTLGAFGLFPMPYDLGFVILGWCYYSLFVFSITVIVGPLTEFSDVLEKLIPVSTYIMIPFSGAFFVVSFLHPDAAAVVLYSPPVHAMEMRRYGLFGPTIDPQYDLYYPLMICLPCLALGLLLCQVARKHLVVE